MITQDQIIEGARFTNGRGIVWIIDKIENDPTHNKIVMTSMEHGQKGNYRDDIKTVVEFLNEENVEKL